MLGNETFIDGKVVFEYGKFKVLYSYSCQSYQVQYGNITVPDAAGESIAHLDCICEILHARLKSVGIETNEIMKGLSRFRVSNYAQEQKEIDRKIKVRFA